MNFKQEISETSFLKQVNIFLHRLYPPPKDESHENLKIAGMFCSDPALNCMKEYQIFCNVTACVKGAIKSTVESMGMMGTKLEHHNMAGH